MNATAKSRFPLDGLLQCGECCAALRVEDGPKPRYVCPGQEGRTTPCGVPAPDAEGLNRLLTREITRSVITGATAQQFREQLGKVLAEDLGEDPHHSVETDLTEDRIRAMAAEALWLQDEEGMPAPADVLGSFVERIEVRPGRATVRYSMPLPPGSQAAGSRSQEIELPEPATE